MGIIWKSQTVTAKSNMIVVQNFSSHQKPFICRDRFEYTFNASYKKVFNFLLILILALYYPYLHSNKVGCVFWISRGIVKRPSGRRTPLYETTAQFSMNKSVPDNWLWSRQNGHHGNDLSKLWIAFNHIICRLQQKIILKAILGTSHLDDANGMFGISVLYLGCLTVFTLTAMEFF